MSRMDRWNEQDFHSKTVVTRTGTQVQRVAKTLVSSVRYKPILAAVIAQYLMANDERPRTISDVIKLAMECFADMILASGQKDRFPDETSAIQFLQSFGLINKGPGGQNIRRIHNNLSMESLQASASEGIVSQSEVDEALRIYNERHVQTTDPGEMAKIMLQTPPEMVKEE